MSGTGPGEIMVETGRRRNALAHGDSELARNEPGSVRQTPRCDAER